MRIQQMQLKNNYSEPNQSEEGHNLEEERLFTPNEAATKLKVTPEQIRSLIRKNQLSAVNVGTGPKRPLYRITQRALNDFLNRRWQPGPARQNKKFKRLAPVQDFFPGLK
jgi:excisionase family DNA binding protein